MRALSQFKRSEWLGKWFEWFKWCWQRNVGGGVISTPATRPRTPCLKSSSTSSSNNLRTNGQTDTLLRLLSLIVYQSSNFISIICCTCYVPCPLCLKSLSASSSNNLRENGQTDTLFNTHYHWYYPIWYQLSPVPATCPNPPCLKSLSGSSICNLQSGSSYFLYLERNMRKTTAQWWLIHKAWHSAGCMYKRNL